MVINHHVNIGVAVAVEDGFNGSSLLKFTDQMSLTQIGANVKDLAGKAKSKKKKFNQQKWKEVHSRFLT